MKRTPLRAKRPTPRRNEGRVAHQRIKPKAAKEPEHLAWVATLPCLVCRSPSTVHHVTSDGFKRIARSDRRVVPLCPRHHQIQHGPRESVEALGHAGFTRQYGLDLLAIADRLWQEHKGGGERPKDEQRSLNPPRSTA